MRRPRSRRALLSSAVPIPIAIAGCSDWELTSSEEAPESGLVPDGAYDCDDIDRPDPPEPHPDDALEPASYPSAPASVLEDGDQYAREFEEAYRNNAFLEEYGSATQSFEFAFENGRMEETEPEADRDAVVVSIVYTVEAETRSATHPTEWYTRVTYYIDDHVALRARNQGVASEPSFDPNPREGDPVDCFE